MNRFVQPVVSETIPEGQVRNNAVRSKLESFFSSESSLAKTVTTLNRDSITPGLIRRSIEKNERQKAAAESNSDEPYENVHFVRMFNSVPPPAPPLPIVQSTLTPIVVKKSQSDLATSSAHQKQLSTFQNFSNTNTRSPVYAKYLCYFTNKCILNAFQMHFLNFYKFPKLFFTFIVQ